MSRIQYIFPGQLVAMIKAQEILNKKFNGEDWRKKMSLGMAKTAMLVEFAEAANEIQATWAWWKRDRTLDLSRAHVEFIDVLHFAMLIALYRNSEEQMIEALYDEEPDMYGPVADPHNNFIKAITRFFTAVDQDNRKNIAVGLYNIINTGALLYAMNPGEVFEVYRLKNERNHERVDGGILEGKYDKSKESDLL